MNTLVELKAIVANAPDGWTHITGSYLYLTWQGNDGKLCKYRHKNAYSWKVCDADILGSYKRIRSRQDIESLIALMEENERLKSVCLNEKVVDLVRCGIGGNYGGDCYEKAITEILEPIVELHKQVGEL